MVYQTEHSSIYITGSNLKNPLKDMSGTRLGCLISGVINKLDTNDHKYNIEIEAFDTEFKFLAVMGVVLSKQEAIDLAEHIMKSYNYA
jgi:hypothetical protein